MPPVITQDDPRLISFNTLRKTVGWLGILLPAAMLLGNFLFSNCRVIQDSNSHYFYTSTGSIFIGILCAVAMFLIAYQGYPEEKTDNVLTTVAGICALGIAFFPTNDNSSESCAIIHLAPSPGRNTAHLLFAATFFLVLAWTSYFLFTKSRGFKTHSKAMRNSVYRTCGILIVVFVALIAAYWKFSSNLHALDKYRPVFWLEWGALIAFGFSWLVKGELVMTDTPEEKAMVVQEAARALQESAALPAQLKQQ